MATPESMAETVKTAIISGSASVSTVTTLQTLLSSVSQPGSLVETATRGVSKPIATSRVTKAIRPPTRPAARARTSKKDQDQDFHIHEDKARTLSTKARYVLATEVVNLSLKVLSEATSKSRKGRQMETCTVQSCDAATPRRHSKTPSSSQRALSTRSGNSTPVRQAPGKPSVPSRTTSRSSIGTAPPSTLQLTAIAECARLGFSSLGSADVKKFGVQSLPGFQLETGMISLASMLISLRLDTVAVKELRATKRKLESLVGVHQNKQAAETNHSVKETLASLLSLKLDFGAHPEAIPVAITYQIQVLRIIMLSRKPMTIEDALQYLTFENPRSPASLMVLSAKTAGNEAKAARQLEALAQNLLQLCPSVSGSADELAQDPSQSPSPLAVFQLQILALQVRKEAWKIIRHTTDLETEVAEPFSKCMGTLVRRLPSRKQASAIYDQCVAAHESLEISSTNVHGTRNSLISRMFALLADEAALPDRSHGWAAIALENCRGVETTHAQYLAATALRLWLFLKAPRSSYRLDDVVSDIRHITESLRSRPAGSKSEYEQLIVELSRLACATTDLVNKAEIHEAWEELLRSAAGFASLYARLFPATNLQTSLAIVNAAILHSHSSEELGPWVSKDTARLFRNAGILRDVTKSASSMPMAQSWRSAGTTLAFARVLRALVIKTVRSESGNHTAMLFDDDNLDAAESGALLEWQLNCALEMAHKSGYQKVMQAIIPYMLRKLLQYYPVNLYPVRRCRTAALAMRIREQFPELLPPHILQQFLDIPVVDVDALEKDIGLGSYVSDINASMGMSLAMRNEAVTFLDLAPNLQIWQDLIQASEQRGSLASVVDNTSTLLSQLTSLEEYARVLGDDLGRLRVSQMLLRASELCDTRFSDRCSYVLKVASAYLALGQAERAGEILDKTRQIMNEDDSVTTVALEYYLCDAERLLALDKVDACQAVLDKAQEKRCELEPHKIKSNQSRAYKLLHGRGWLLQSRCFLASGFPGDALRAANRSAKVLNSIWAGIERMRDQSLKRDMIELEGEPEEPSMDSLSDKVSKLKLQPKTRDSRTSAKPEVRGAAFWSVAQLLCQALMHLSEVYAHHGVFAEANYSSEQAMRIAESLQSQVLLSRVRSHRCVLLSAAGRVEAAELCLAQDEDESPPVPSLATVERLRAKCALSLKTGELADALKYITNGVSTVVSIKSIEHAVGNQGQALINDAASGKDLRTKATPKTASRSTAARLAPKTKPVPTATPRATTLGKTGKGTAQGARLHGAQTDGTDACYVLDKLEDQLILQGARISMKLGCVADETTTRVTDALVRLPASFSRLRFEHDSAMRKVASTLESDFAYNILPDTTLSLPATQPANSSSEVLASTAMKPTTKSKRVAKSKLKVSSTQSLGSLLLAAQQRLLLDIPAARLLSTFETHEQYSMLSNTTMLLSAASADTEASTSKLEALAVDYPRVHAAKCQLVLADLEKETFQVSDLLAWPSSKASTPEVATTMNKFQADYIDVLPTPWTAISIGLSEDCDELYITRYRRGQAPFILRLPFSRQNTEDNDELFDFRAGREELKEIIELSNYSCHNPIDAGAKGAKNNWWSEREALDLRLHELLQNIENIWLGGFRGVLSQHTRDADQLGRFRKDLETALDRHLPSRQAAKRGATKISLDDHVLELFIGLGNDQDGEIDLDELLSDLLYFVVDLLQFSGERNACDEVDFDSMAIEVLDALRSYRVEEDDQDDAHLILVLDRRLQAFPWESLPCLQNASVSRVDSMLCLRDRILEMRKQYGKESARCTVTQHSGSYILNPSADLMNTEANLSPELSKLAQAENGEWKGIIRRQPTEEEFSAALTTSSMLLYFGHGAGSQYIRPRAIRRLVKCSKVVWLMGCSSGAVTEHDELEPHAVPLAYLLAGQNSENRSSIDVKDSNKCMSVLATLWDVTDKDIDRFSLAVGEEWGLWTVSRESSKISGKSPRKREAVAVPLTPKRAAKTPKTPKVRDTPAPARSPARSRSRARGFEKKQSLVQAVSKSRDACYLRYLNGAAPVVYGIPVYLGD